MTVENGAHEFFEAYRTAFEALDARTIGDFFAYPCQVTSDADRVTVQTVSSREAWTPVLEGLVGAYRRIGVQSAEMLELQVFALSPRLMQASVGWRLIDGKGRALYDFDSSYTVADLGEGWRITAIAHNEGPRLREQMPRRPPA